MYTILQIYFLASNNRVSQWIGFSSFLFCIIYVFCVHCCVLRTVRNANVNWIWKATGIFTQFIRLQQYFHQSFSRTGTYSHHAMVYNIQYNIRHGIGACNDTDTNTHKSLHRFAVGWKRLCGWKRSATSKNISSNDWYEILHVFYITIPLNPIDFLQQMAEIEETLRISSNFKGKRKQIVSISIPSERYSAALRSDYLKGWCNVNSCTKINSIRWSCRNSAECSHGKPNECALAAVYPMHRMENVNRLGFSSYGYSTFCTIRMCITACRNVHVQRNPEAPLAM